MSATASPVKLVLVTGLSGSGKSTAGKCFEDLGYYCVDNLPVSLLRTLLESPAQHLADRRRVAVITDVRAAGLASELPGLLDEIDREKVQPSVLFLEASDETLVRRFSETRRRHPLTDAGDAPRPLIDAIAEERRLLTELRGIADVVLDTNDFSIHDVRREITGRFGDREAVGPQLLVSLVSFGFKYGIPYGTDLLFDVRFLTNPYFAAELRGRTGRDPAVVAFLERESDFSDIVARLWQLLSFLLPRYRDENRSYLTVAVGCTGGKHRSVAVCEALARELRAATWPFRLDHRDLGRDREW
ncbi:MAG: RNase adapter RapZ, partial [Thermoanaerobaculia bacterium]|nr:RNase adapter RapZ [Thermoanaerobaculia bacterium]